MKKLILISALLLFISCRRDKHEDNVQDISENTEQAQNNTYDITYTDGTHETVTLADELGFSKEGDCITTCGCFEEKFKRCGVRKFDLVIQDKSKDSSVAVVPKVDTLIVKVPTNLKH